MSKKVAVILSGCGVQDGAEIHEATLTLYFLDRAGATIVCAAPNRPQARVADHVTGKDAPETRNVLVESARIARGEIRDLKTLRVDEIAVDVKHKLVTTPAYMLASGPAQAGAGIEKLVNKVLEMA